MPAPVSWYKDVPTGSPWASFPGGIGAPGIGPGPAIGGGRKRFRRASRKTSRKIRKTSRKTSRRASRKIRKVSRKTSRKQSRK